MKHLKIISACTVLVIIIVFLLKSNTEVGTNVEPSPTTEDTIKRDTIIKTVELEALPTAINAFDIEVYFFDVSSLKNILPYYSGRPTYTGSVYVADYQKKTLKGPYSTSSTFPNSREYNLRETFYNTVAEGPHIFNNRSGHKGANSRGLNLVLQTGLKRGEGRYNLGFDKNGDTVIMNLVNIHGGKSDLGNYNSRGSHGCLTILPKDTLQFFKQFGMETKTTGNMEGGLYVFRSDDEIVVEQILNQIKSELK